MNYLLIWIFVYFLGNCEAGPPLYTCRFPRRPLWGVKSCTRLKCSSCFSSRSKVLSQYQSSKVEDGAEVWRAKWKPKLVYETDVLNEMLYIWIQLRSEGSLFPQIPILIFREAVLVQVVYPLPSWYVSSGEFMKFLLWVFFAGKKHLLMGKKALTIYAFCEMLSETVCVFVCVHVCT